ncbi:hypothetical protein [Pseudomonas sp. Z3-8]|uniref:hypothetical protein n=1 Tax=Pseudomonas sp. Z3-8 TaxID=2817412 RepID=UPI003DA8A3E9
MEQKMNTPEKLKSALDAYRQRQEQKDQRIKFELEQLRTSVKEFFQMTNRYVYNVVAPFHEPVQITARFGDESIGFDTQKIIFPVTDHRIEFIPTFTRNNEFGFRTSGLQQELLILPKQNRWQAYSQDGTVIESEFTSEYFVSLLMSVIPNN